MPKKTGVLTTLDDNDNIVEMYPEVVTDSTLSISGKPADAAAVGEALSNVQPGGDNSVTLTLAEYNALSDEEKDSDTTYYITDGDAQPNAFSVPFTSDKYTATNAGDALNEVKTELEETNSNLNLDNVLMYRDVIVGSIRNLSLKTGIYTVGGTATDIPSGYDSAGILIVIRRSMYSSTDPEMVSLEYIDSYNRRTHCTCLHGTWSDWSA